MISCLNRLTKTVSRTKTTFVSKMKEGTEKGVRFNVFLNDADMKKELERQNVDSSLYDEFITQKELNQINLWTETGIQYFYTMKTDKAKKELAVFDKFKSTGKYLIDTSASLKLDSPTVKFFSESDSDVLQLKTFLEYYNYKHTCLRKEEQKEYFVDRINMESLADVPEQLDQELDVTLKNKEECRRNLNHRSDSLTPLLFIEKARSFAKENNLKFTSFYDNELKEEGLNLIHAVGRGSINRPGLFVIEYNGATESDKTLALVGKGVTYDTGGYNIKRTGSMEDMHMDKGGACAVFSAFCNAVDLKLPINLICAVPLAENSIDDTSYKPGDIIKSHNGLSVEITNTDAEGRLILCDAMSYVQKKHNIDTMIELSTLTYATMISLGDEHAALFSNDDETAEKLLDKCGNKFNERVWRMPLSDKKAELLKGGVSDLINTSKNANGSAIESAEYLKYFVEDGVKWVHLDIAGVTLDSDIKYNKGNKNVASGYGVGLLTDFMKKYK